MKEFMFTSKRISGLVAAILLSHSLVKAQFTLSGEVTPRTEYRHGFKKLIGEDMDPAFFTEQRTRLVGLYQSVNYDFKISLQDVRTWGSVSQVYKTDPSLTAIHEAWFKYNISDKFAAKVGRQELNYDNARFLGDLGWAMQSRSHDLVKFIYADSLFTVHAGVAFNQDANTPEFKKLSSTYYSGVNNYKTMQYLWANYSSGPTSLSFLFLNNGVQVGTVDSSGMEYSQTLGLFAKSKVASFGFTGEVYYQTGKDVVGTNLNAYLIAASASYLGIKKLTPTVGFDLLSGTEATATENNSFTPLYGTNHKFYGFMDYFYVGNPHGNLGLLDIYLKTKLVLGKKSVILAHAHQFASAVDISGSDRGLGTEIDLVYTYNVFKGVSIKAGYSQLFATKTMELVKGGSKDEMNNWAWVMISVKPTFFTLK